MLNVIYERLKPTYNKSIGEAQLVMILILLVKGSHIDYQES
jgi:hypothetical protein